MELVDTARVPATDAAASAVPIEPTPEQLADEAAQQAAAEREVQLQRLLQRMQQHADFPSLRDSIRSIQGVARSESAHLRTLTDEVLGDVALSNKLLRMINTAYYSSVGAGTIDSLARAVSLMGFGPVAMLASSLTLFDKLPKGPDGARVQQEFGRALLAAMLANQFCPIRRLEESAYIAALFQNLGTMLAWMHFPAEAAEIEALAGRCRPQRPRRAAGRLAQGARGLLRRTRDRGDAAAGAGPKTCSWRCASSTRPIRKHRRRRTTTCASSAARRTGSRSTSTRSTAVPALERCLARFHAGHAIPLGLAEEDLAPMVERARAQWGDLALVLGFARLQAKPQPKPAAPRRGAGGCAATGAPWQRRGGARRRRCRPRGSGCRAPAGGAQRSAHHAGAERRPRCAQPAGDVGRTDRRCAAAADDAAARGDESAAGGDLPARSGRAANSSAATAAATARHRLPPSSASRCSHRSTCSACCARAMPIR